MTLDGRSATISAICITILTICDTISGICDELEGHLRCGDDQNQHLKHYPRHLY
jgi:hypothetical protein